MYKDAWERGQRAWPDLMVSFKAFSDHLEALGEQQPRLGKIELAHGEDLYLCCACNLEIPAAVVALNHLMQDLPQWIRKFDRSPDFADEVRQRLCERLLVPADGKRRITEYAGSGPLRAWLRIAAMRMALNLRRNKDDQPGVHVSPEEVELRALSEEPELRSLKAEHQDSLRQALREAFLGLPKEQRQVLRLHYAGGLSGDEIARALQIHRATVVRWLASARIWMLTQTRRLLAERLHAPASEVDSLLGALQENLDLSLSSLLRTLDEDVQIK